MPSPPTTAASAYTTRPLSPTIWAQKLRHIDRTSAPQQAARFLLRETSVRGASARRVRRAIIAASRTVAASNRAKSTVGSL